MTACSKPSILRYSKSGDKVTAVRRFAATWITSALAGPLIQTHLLTDVDLFDVAGRLLERIARNYLDAFIIAGFS